MDDEGKERVIAERLSLSDSTVLSFGRETKERKGARERIRTAGSIARHDGSCWGFREPDKEGHLYLARRDRCSTIIDLRDGSIKRERERERKREREEAKERGEGKVLTRSSRAQPDNVEHVDWCARSRDRAYLFLTYIVLHANTVQEKTGTLCQRSWII